MKYRLLGSSGCAIAFACCPDRKASRGVSACGGRAQFISLR
jgi:hypothetical protein